MGVEIHTQISVFIKKKIFPKRPTDFLPDLDSSISSGRVPRS